MNDEQNEIPVFDESGLTDTQTRFFSEHEDKIKRYRAESDLENLSKEANFFLNQFKNSLRKNNELKEINKHLGQRIDQEQSSKKRRNCKTRPSRLSVFQRTQIDLQDVRQNRRQRNPRKPGTERPHRKTRPDEEVDGRNGTSFSMRATK